MNEQKNNGRGIFYGVIGVATLVVAIIGATFAYFTAQQSANNAFTGEMASITFGLEVEKVTTADEVKGGMIPMSNSMVEAALSGKNDSVKVGGDGANKDDIADPICVDNNGNAVCQIYKISVTNNGTAGMFLDGYVTLTGGSGVATDTSYTNLVGENAGTTMRWAQVFCEGTDNALTSCSTAGVSTTDGTTTSGDTKGIDGANWDAIQKLESAEGTVVSEHGKNAEQILKTGVTSDATINEKTYPVIDKNYIRISDHVDGVGYNRTNDVTSALVFNQFIAPSTGGSVTTSTDSTESMKDVQVYYIVVWLSETGHNQTAGSNGTNVPALGSNFFTGDVVFNSAQGSEVTATFSGYTAVQSDQANNGQAGE